MHAQEDDAIVGINVTPLVDIVLVLLVVFMVCARLIASQSVPMDLPKAATAGAAQTMLVVNVDEGGKVTVDGRPVDDLRSTAEGALAREHDLRVLVQAPANARHGAIVGVIDTLRSAGVARIAFAAEKIP